MDLSEGCPLKGSRGRGEAPRPWCSGLRAASRCPSAPRAAPPGSPLVGQQGPSARDAGTPGTSVGPLRPPAARLPAATGSPPGPCGEPGPRPRLSTPCADPAVGARGSLPSPGRASGSGSWPASCLLSGGLKSRVLSGAPKCDRDALWRPGLRRVLDTRRPFIWRLSSPPLGRRLVSLFCCCFSETLTCVLSFLNSFHRENVFDPIFHRLLLRPINFPRICHLLSFISCHAVSFLRLFCSVAVALLYLEHVH